MKREFIVQRDGKDFVLYAGLLDEAHDRGLKAITTTLIQTPSELNGYVTICHATVETEQGTFTGIGDASPNNVTRMMAPHMIRMAETRAKARALRDAVNVGVTALEELGEDGGHAEPEPPRRPAQRPAPDRSEDGGHAEPQPNVPWPEPDDAPPPGLEGAVVVRRGDASPKPAGYADRVVQDARATAAAQGNGGPPATPKQIETIQRMARKAGKQIAIPAEGLSRAGASEIISELIGEMGEARSS